MSDIFLIKKVISDKIRSFIGNSRLIDTVKSSEGNVFTSNVYLCLPLIP